MEAASSLNMQIDKREINHSFHHHTLIFHNRGSYYCASCQKYFESSPSYRCNKCNFDMCVKCYHATIRPFIKYRYHEHLLCFNEEYSNHLAQCEASDNYCHLKVASNDLHRATNSLFLCVDCDFKIHFICGPLPIIIKHECHMHPLILVNSVVEANCDEYYCDVCEFERNPRVRVYYCEECQYIAHPHCVIYEIVKAFKGGLGDVELNVIGQDFWEEPQEKWDITSSSSTLLDLLSSNDLTTNEKLFLGVWFNWDKSSKEEEAQVEVADEDVDEIITRYPFFNQQDFTNFFFEDFERFSHNEKLVVKCSELSLKIVRVQGYSIPVTLAPVLQTILNKYPQISSDSNWTPTMKSICFFFLCKVRNSMHTTRFADITKNLLREWYYYLHFVSEKAKFRIDFLVEALAMITLAFFGLQLARLEKEIPTNLTKNIDMLQQEIAKLQQEIVDLKAKEDICDKRFKSSSDPEFIKDSMREGVELKWKTGDQVLF